MRPGSHRGDRPGVEPDAEGAIEVSNWHGVLQVRLARLGPWTLALPAEQVLGQLAAPARMLQLPQGDTLVLTEYGALPEVGLESCWGLPAQEAPGDHLLLRDGEVGYALRVQQVQQQQALHFWALPAQLGAALGLAAAAVLNEPPQVPGLQPAPAELALLLDPGFVASEHARAQLLRQAAGCADLEQGES
jgi:hypothetical protein